MALMSLDHAFTSEALTKLTDAVDAMATEAGYDVKVDIAKQNSMQTKPMQLRLIREYMNF